MHMGKIEGGASGRNNIENQVNDALIPQNGEVNEPLADHEYLVHETRILKDKLAAKRRETANGDEFTTKMYGAAYHLTNALEYVLDETTDVSKIDSETGQNDNAGNIGRDMFVNAIKNALNYLGMDGSAVKEALSEEGEP